MDLHQPLNAQWDITIWSLRRLHLCISLPRAGSLHWDSEKQRSFGFCKMWQFRIGSLISAMMPLKKVRPKFWRIHLHLARRGLIRHRLGELHWTRSHNELNLDTAWKTFHRQALPSTLSQIPTQPSCYSCKILLYIAISLAGLIQRILHLWQPSTKRFYKQSSTI